MPMRPHDCFRGVRPPGRALAFAADPCGLRQQTGIPLDYAAIDAEPDDFVARAGAPSPHGRRGANVTLPLKQRALRAVRHAQRARAPRRRGEHAGPQRRRLARRQHRRRGPGARPHRSPGLDLRARRTLLLGAGGAARGVAPALLDAGIGDLYIVNRTPERADALADALGEPGRVHPRYLDDLPSHGEFDLIINATSAARDGSAARPCRVAGRRAVARRWT